MCDFKYIFQSCFLYSVILAGLILYPSRTWSQSDHGAPITHLTVSLDGHAIAASYGKQVLVWSYFKNSSAKMKAKLSHNQLVTCLSFFPDAQQLITCENTESGKTRITIWLERLEKFSKKKYIDFNFVVTSLAVFQNEQTIIAGDSNGGINVISVSDNDMRIVRKEKIFEAPVSNIAIANNKKYIAVTSRNIVKELEWPINSAVRTVRAIETREKVSCIKYTKDSEYFGVVYSDIKGRMYHVKRSENDLRLPFLGYDNPIGNSISCLEFFDNDNYLALSYLDGAIRLFRNHGPGQWNQKFTFARTYPTVAISSIPNKGVFITGSVDGEVSLWTVNEKLSVLDLRSVRSGSSLGSQGRIPNQVLFGDRSRVGRRLTTELSFSDGVEEEIQELGQTLLECVKSGNCNHEKVLVEVYGKKSIPALQAMLQYDDREVRFTAIILLCYLKEEASTAASDMVSALEDGDEMVRITAKRCLIRLGTEALPALITAFKENKNHTRDMIEVLKSLPADALIPYLIPELRDVDNWSTILTILDKGTDSTSEQILISTVQENRLDSEVRLGVIWILGELSAPVTNDRLSTLKKLTSDQDQRIREFANDALQNVGRR